MRGTSVDPGLVVRMLANLDQDSARVSGPAGAANLLTVTHTAGVSPEAVRWALLAVAPLFTVRRIPSTLRVME